MRNGIAVTPLLYLSLILFAFILIGYSIWSYGLTDPNLVLINWEPYWQFQQWAWQTFFHNRPMQTITYVVLISLLFVNYGVITWLFRKLELKMETFKKFLVAMGIYLFVISPLLFSYNALSHDVFNYIFNARMVIEYQANPHSEVALGYSFDPWTRFMHNTHTTAPYWYGWTVISLIPYLLGFGSFLITWLNFKLFALVSLLLYGMIMWFWKNQQKQTLEHWQLGLVMLNPLVLVEIVGNSHNDFWMMVPALLAFLLLLNRPKQMHWLGLSLLSLIFSASTKYATLVLLPVWLIVGKLFTINWGIPKTTNAITSILFKFQNSLKTTFFNSFLNYVVQLVPWILSILLFLPLLTSRSRWFLPWYLLWSLSLVPLLVKSTVLNRELPKISLLPLASIKKQINNWRKRWVYLLVALSISSLIRYVPWLWYGEYSDLITSQEIVITWLGGLMVFCLFCVTDYFTAKRSDS